MDFVKLLKSLEELLYEVMVMLVFFPRTLYLTFRHPQRMMDYADTELGDVQSEQYHDTLSPPTAIFWGGLAWYLVQQVLWFRAKLDVANGSAALNAIGASFSAVLLTVFTGVSIGFLTVAERAS